MSKHKYHKKVVFFICIFIVALASQVFATETTMIKVIPNTINNEVIISVGYTGSNMCGGSFNFTYDTTTLSFVSAEEGDAIKNTSHFINPEFVDGGIRVNWGSATEMPTDGKLIDIKFNLLDGTLKKSDIGIENLKIADGNGNKQDADYIIVYEDAEQLESPTGGETENTANTSTLRPSNGLDGLRPSKNNGIKQNEVDLNDGLPFSDVKESDWYYEAVKFAFEKGITSGISENLYAPNDKVTRGQFITMLCRAYGIKEMTGDNFSDCGNTWYTGYLASAKQLGISNGVEDNKFAPEKEVSREEMVTLIYNYLNSVGKVDEELTETTFTDNDTISDWAKSGVAFASSKGYVNGKGNNIFDPNGNATRAELAQIFFNMFR